MNVLTELKVGDKIEIELLRVGKYLKNKTIVSQVMDIKENHLMISSPIKQGMSYLLHEGQKINVIFYREEKGVFSFTAEVIKRLDLRLPMYIIQPQTTANKIQRRSYFRLKVLTKVLLRNLNESNAIECFTKDISGGGLRITSKKKFEENQKVECVIFLGNDNTITVTSEIVRVIKDPTKNEYEISLRYEDITDNARNQIISFVFKKQRELRQKGLI